MYDAVADALPDIGPVPVCALPDGSRDTHVHVFDSADRVTSRDDFAVRLAAGERAFRLVEQRRAAGGQSVNMARQAHALGAATTLFGHTDATFPFETVPLGEPADVTVCDFDDGDLMLAAESDDLLNCDADRLREAGAFDRRPDCWLVANFASLPGLPNVLDSLPEGLATLDTGPITGIGTPRAERLRAVADARTVVSANRAESEALAAALDTTVEALRRELGVRAFVVHERERAVGFSDRDGEERVEVRAFR